MAQAEYVKVQWHRSGWNSGKMHEWIQKAWLGEVRYEERVPLPIRQRSEKAPLPQKKTRVSWYQKAHFAIFWIFWYKMKITNNPDGLPPIQTN